MKKSLDEKIVASWQKNVQPWVRAIQNNEISSRVNVTNQAIVSAVLECKPRKVLDVGCGEGWLVRALVNAGSDALGVDVIPEFIRYAQQQGPGRFKVLPYEEITASALREKFDVVVCNFSLLGKESVDELFKRVPPLLQENGRFIVQTIHPVAGCGEAEYQDGWREGSWAGFNQQFTDPAPWYFRTLETWKALFKDSGFVLRSIREPSNPDTNTITSIVFEAEYVGSRAIPSPSGTSVPLDGRRSG